MDNREIAKQVSNNSKAIKYHSSRIKSKFEIFGPSKLFRFALRLQNKAFRLFRSNIQDRTDGNLKSFVDCAIQIDFCIALPKKSILLTNLR